MRTTESHRTTAKYAKRSTCNSFCTAKLCTDILNDGDEILHRIRRVTLPGKAQNGASAVIAAAGSHTESAAGGLVSLVLLFSPDELINRKAGMDPGYKSKS